MMGILEDDPKSLVAHDVIGVLGHEVVLSIFRILFYGRWMHVFKIMFLLI